MDGSIIKVKNIKKEKDKCVTKSRNAWALTSSLKGQENHWPKLWVVQQGISLQKKEKQFK